MKNTIYLLFFVIIYNSHAQTETENSNSENKNPSSNWIIKNRAALDISEVAFVNWNSGGTNSIAALIAITSQANYKFKHFYWNNNINVRYGTNKQQSQELRKTEDLIEINSNVGYRKDTLSNWFYTSRLNFKTQLANGYSYPNTEKEISKFMAPAYLHYGVGIEYGKNIEKLSAYFSPVTLKSTFVLDQELANTGAFGVTQAEVDEAGNLIKKGSKVRNEFGLLLTNAFETQIAKNVYMKNLLGFYTDYINDFGNIDVDWQLNLDFKVNNYIRANLGSHLKYDDDVKTIIAIENEEAEEAFAEEGPKVQWKQVLGIGVVVDF